MRSLWMRTVVTALAIAATLGLAALPTAQAETPNTPGALIGGTNHNCFFYYGAAGPSENAAGEKSANIAYPDAGAYYWGAYIRVPAGSTLKLHGQFPYARYMSLVGYNAAGNTIDGLDDEMINPDPGSQNPFRAGVPRNTPNRNYTVEVINKALPTELTNEKGEKYKTSKALHFAEEPARPNNELYDGAPAANKEKLVNQETKAQTAEYETELVVLRVYVPNKGMNQLGGVPLPEPELKLSAAEGGGTLHGSEVCPKTDSESTARRSEQEANKEAPSYRLPELQSLLLNKSVWRALSKPWSLTEPCNVAATAAEIKAAGEVCPKVKSPLVAAELEQLPRAIENQAAFPATETENWRGQFTRKYLLQAWTGEGPGIGAETSPLKEGGGGFFPNIDNNYERDLLSRTFGKVVVAKGKLPTSPETYENETGTLPATSSFQDRYTSFCMNQSPRTTMVMACVYDEQIPTNENRDYTIAVSRPEDKPKNAVPFCGVAWIPWSREGDGEEAPETNEEFGMLQMRTMLPNRSFGHAAQNVVKAGTDREVMGEYLPKVSYNAEASTFEAGQGCSWSTPGSPQLTAGSSPNNGAFTVAWAPNPHAAKVSGVTYTLERKDANGGWEVLASGLSSPEYTVSAEAEGTWRYRVRASGEGAESGTSGESAAVVVDRTGPPAPTAVLSRAPDYSGVSGEWFTGSVMVSFSSNGVATLPDGSEGAALEPSSLTATKTVSESSPAVCGTVSDVLGNQSAEGCVPVKVDNTPPALSVTCPTMVAIGSHASATVAASDSLSGLAVDPSGSVAIDTSRAGTQTVTRTATSNVGLSTTQSCTTMVGYYEVITGPVNGSLNVRAGEAVELASTATVSGGVTVKAGGALDIEGARVSRGLSSKGAALLRVCGARIGAGLTAIESTGPVVIGEAGGCAGSTVTGAVGVRSNTSSVLIEGNTLGSNLTVTKNSDGVTVTGNKVTKTLTVTGNTGTVIDRPNQVTGRSKIQ